MTLEVATQILRAEGEMTGVEIALVTFMRHTVQRFETLSVEVAGLHEAVAELEGRIDGLLLMNKGGK